MGHIKKMRMYAISQAKPRPWSSIWQIGVKKTPVVMVEPPKRRVLSCYETSVPFPTQNLI
jgi:hypothetical protein